MAKPRIRSPLRHLQASAVSRAARAESRNREHRLPPVSVFRWWARRTDAVFGAIIEGLQQDRQGVLTIADPFAGGGVISLAALSRGCQVYAQEIDPWAANGIALMLNLPEAGDFGRASQSFATRAESLALAAYGTTGSDGLPAIISHTFRVAEAPCSECGRCGVLYPHALVTLLARVERGRAEAYLACPLGHLFRGNRVGIQACPICSEQTDPEAVYTRRRLVACPTCGARESLASRASNQKLGWKVVLVERVRSCGTREIDIPTPQEIAQADDRCWEPTRELSPIPVGQETRVLLRHGFERWTDLYPRRQRVVLEQLLELASEVDTSPVGRRLLRLAIVGAAEMAGFASRWDRYYLKSYEAMANHRFNFTTFSAEPNVWGTASSGRGTVRRRLRLFQRACSWFSARCSGARVAGPVRSTAAHRMLDRGGSLVVLGSSQRMVLRSGTCSAVVTDPPYHDDVQYRELSLPLRAWAELGGDIQEQDCDAVVNRATGHNTEAGAYCALLTQIFSEAHRVLENDGHLILSYANREPEAWIALFEALETAGFRAVGYAILHSENETDLAKRGVGACNHDLIMDLVPKGPTQIEQFAPDGPWRLPEQRFLALIGAQSLEIGAADIGWQERFIATVQGSEFINKSSARRAPRAPVHLTVQS